MLRNNVDKVRIVEFDVDNLSIRSGFYGNNKYRMKTGVKIVFFIRMSTYTTNNIMDDYIWLMCYLRTAKVVFI